MNIDIAKYNELIEYNNIAVDNLNNFKNPWKTFSKASPFIAMGFGIILFFACCSFNSIAICITFILSIVSIIFLIVSKILNVNYNKKYEHLKLEQSNAFNNIRTFVYDYMTAKFNMNNAALNSYIVEFYNLNKDNKFDTSWWQSLASIKLVEDFLFLNDKLNAYIIQQTKYPLSYWDSRFNETNFNVNVKSSKAVDNYDDVKFFKEYPDKLNAANKIVEAKAFYKKCVQDFLAQSNTYTNENLNYYQNTIKKKLSMMMPLYNVSISYVSPTGRSTNGTLIRIDEYRLKQFEQDKSILMSKSEYSKYLKSQQQDELNNKQKQYYNLVNEIIDKVNNVKASIISLDDRNKLDNLVSSLFDKTVNSIKRIKNIDSEEWILIYNIITNISGEIQIIIDKNQKILDYYDSKDFNALKQSCQTLMSNQREFNEYIEEKANAISSMFGTNIIRGETTFQDEYNYIRPYKKDLDPFTAEVSEAVFSSAENNPLDYVIKYFYQDKEKYPEQIQNLQTLIEELETLKEAKEIIETNKKEYQQYLTNVPSYILEYDKDGFYSRLGFANLNESRLVVAYKFSYTSPGCRTQKSFPIYMTEDTIISLINKLQDKLTYASFAKEQRSLMTGKLRQQIKERDNFTCKYCGNSIYKEPNLLLEVDHIIPIKKGGLTEESNLQTLCWRCNRSKSSKIIKKPTTIKIKL